MEIQNQEKILVIDFGGQYNQLVARRVRENNVYCEIYSYRTPLEKIREEEIQAAEIFQDGFFIPGLIPGVFCEDACRHAQGHNQSKQNT